jgi:myosin heavy subunit
MKQNTNYAKRTLKVTVGSQFHHQLEDLMMARNGTEPHFIRAIKPNMEKVPNKFQGTLSLQQLRYAGVFEAVKIRQTAYPLRYPHLEFLQRYAILNKPIDLRNDLSVIAVQLSIAVQLGFAVLANAVSLSNSLAPST